ncbi:hypothetical protein PF003_g398 [Phytophthora fragariae]|nr:hypothetical protein PF003_g9299 [Phytophthora fragariae]KAE8915558.1 hypothetical protein PF003_g398 [Phytophthora fragariae]
MKKALHCGGAHVLRPPSGKPQGSRIVEVLMQ